MAVAKMQRISIAGNMNELDAVTEVCGQSSVFHPDKNVDLGESAKRFHALVEENPYDAMLKRFEETLGLVSKKPKIKLGTKLMQMDTAEVKAYVDRLYERFETMKNARTNVLRMIEVAEEEISHLKHFVGLNVNLQEIFGTKLIKVRFGAIPKRNHTILENTYRDDPYVTFFDCTEDKEWVWGMYLAPLEQEYKIDKIFAKLHFKRLRLRSFSGTPAEILEQLTLEDEESKKHLKEINSRIKDAWAAEKEKIACVYLWLKQKTVCFSIRRFAYRHGMSFVLSGWVPKRDAGKITGGLKALSSVEFELSSPEQDDSDAEPPIKLQNNRLSRPYEFFVGMYGLPNYQEMDPTLLVSILFTVLFGIMFADLGQGLVIALFGFFYMWKKREMAVGRILVPCGISACVFGTIFGSVFGFEHALNPLYHMLGFADKPINVMDSDTVIYIILAAVIIGFVCVSIAMLINIVTSMRRRHWTRALFGQNGVAALVFYWAVVLGAVSPMLGGPTLLTTPYILGLIVLPLALMFFQEPLGSLVEGHFEKPEKWGSYLVQSFFELFEMLLSLLSNTVSFLRIGAFVLVHSGMMMMVMILCEMAGPAGSFGYIAMAVFGNIFVTVLETLLVCIHVLRLNYYEMFSRFYDGGGTPYEPVDIFS